MQDMNNKEKAPLFGSWRGWYLFVLFVLLGLIVFFQWLTKTYA